MKRTGLSTIVFLVLAASPALAQAVTQQKPAWQKLQTVNPLSLAKGSAPWWRTAVASAIALTPDQQKKMDDVFQDARIRLIPLEAALEVQEAILEPLMAAEQLDEGKINAQIDRVAQARADLEKANARMLLGIRQALTLEQWITLQKITLKIPHLDLEVKKQKPIKH